MLPASPKLKKKTIDEVREEMSRVVAEARLLADKYDEHVKTLGLDMDMVREFINLPSWSEEEKAESQVDAKEWDDDLKREVDNAVAEKKQELKAIRRQERGGTRKKKGTGRRRTGFL
ncbi:hypothetical protein [Spongorhabdus nitratireducens]